MWHGYFLLRVSDSVSLANRVLLRDALLSMGRQREDDDSQPARITHLRQSLDRRAVICELFVSSEPTRAQAVAKLAQRLPFTEAQIDASIEQFLVSPGASWEERRQATAQYIARNIADWDAGQD